MSESRDKQGEDEGNQHIIETKEEVIEGKTERPRCYGIMSLYSDFDEICYLRHAIFD
ncbi:MAG: hypothetical protein WAK17_15360 [Candidatus Nitrosopolaris sp.]|jgi:hypothetical protein